MAYQQRGMEILKKLETAIEQVAKIEQVPTLEGKHMIMVGTKVDLLIKSPLH